MPSVIDVVITPSEFAKSSCKNVFLDVLSTCGFPEQPLRNFVQEDLSLLPSGGASMNLDLNFSFSWKGEVEEASYKPLQEFLESRNIVVKNISNGQGLIDGLLFHQEIWTLKKNILQTSGDWKSDTRVLKYILRGRTDFVRLNQRRFEVTKRNIQYYIEIKRGGIAEVELKEAFYQLLGGNAANPYRSPPVFLTNLSTDHFVLFITQCANPDVALLYELQIFKFPTFSSAMNYLEGTTCELESCTKDFLRRPTPCSSLKKDQDGDDNDDDLKDSKVSIEEVLDVDGSFEDGDGYR